MATHLDPSNEDHASDRVVELGLPVAEELKVDILVVIGQDGLEELADFDLSVDIENDADVGDQQDDHIENVPNGGEVFELVFLDLFERQELEVKISRSLVWQEV